MKDYPQIALRLPEEMKKALKLLSIVRAQPQWRIFCDAIDCYLRELPAEERRRMAALSSRSSRRSK